MVKIAVIANKVWQLLNTVIVAYTHFVPLSAEKEIKRGEKLMARYQTGKMQSKPGSSGDKTIIGEKTSAVYNAYITGITSYNAPEAAARAHHLHIKTVSKRFQTAVLAQLAVSVIFSMITGKWFKLPVIVALSLVAIVTGQKWKKPIMYTINALCCSNFIPLVIDIAMTTLTYFNMIPTDLQPVVSILYMCCKTFFSIL